ncbi:MAG TPA: hypothetical protein VIL52_03765 [Bacteroidota bacterium]
MRPLDPEQQYREVIQRLSAEERLRIVFELHEMGRELVRAGIRSLHPTWDEKSVEAEMKERLYLYADTRRDSASHSRPT